MATLAPIVLTPSINIYGQSVKCMMSIELVSKLIISLYFREQK